MNDSNKQYQQVEQNQNIQHEKSQLQNQGVAQYQNFLKDEARDGKQRQSWTAAEQQLFLQGLLQQDGNSKSIAQVIGTRSASQVQSHIQKHNQKLQQIQQKTLQFIQDNVELSTQSFILKMKLLSDKQNINIQIIHDCVQYPGQFTNSLTSQFESQQMLTLNTINKIPILQEALQGQLKAPCSDMVKVVIRDNIPNVVDFSQQCPMVNFYQMSYFCETYLTMWVVVQSQNGPIEAIKKVMFILKMMEQLLEHDYYYQYISKLLNITPDDVLMINFCGILLKAANTYNY